MPNNQKQILQVKEKIEHILEETRIILPGTQALLGFQFVAIFSNGFEKISLSLKNMHIISLLAVTVSIILLLAIPSFHRISEKGTDTSRLHKVGSFILEIALFFLLLGLILDTYVVIFTANKSTLFTMIGTGIVIIVALVMWFILPSILRNHAE